MYVQPRRSNESHAKHAWLHTLLLLFRSVSIPIYHVFCCKTRSTLFPLEIQWFWGTARIEMFNKSNLKQRKSESFWSEMIINTRKTVPLQYNSCLTTEDTHICLTYSSLLILCIIILLASLIFEVSIESRYTCVVL